MVQAELTPASAVPAVGRKASAPERPWLKSYPKDVDWGMDLEPILLTSLLDEAVAAYGPRACTYFMGKRLSFAEIGSLSDRAAKGLQELGVGEGVKVGLL
ncbi:MAG: long-chain fatty acid--CoA ligase, partial [Chloroflexi bacterium]